MIAAVVLLVLAQVLLWSLPFPWWLLSLVPSAVAVWCASGQPAQLLARRGQRP